MNKTAEMEINVSGGRIIHSKELECKINPLAFPLDADWLQYDPKTDNQMKMKYLFLEARMKGRLHPFTCMVIDPSYDKERGKILYKKGVSPEVGHSNEWWVDMFENYAPNRNSRQLSITEGVCKRLEIIKRLVEWRAWTIEKAWYAVCDDSIEIGHFCNSQDSKNHFEVTGSREIVGFYDLGNAYKMLSEDPWDKAGGVWGSGGSYQDCSREFSLGRLDHYMYSDVKYVGACGVGEIGLD